MDLSGILVFIEHLAKYLHMCLFGLLAEAWVPTLHLQALMMVVDILRGQGHLYFWLHRLVRLPSPSSLLPQILLERSWTKVRRIHAQICASSSSW